MRISVCTYVRSLSHYLPAFGGCWWLARWAGRMHVSMYNVCTPSSARLLYWSTRNNHTICFPSWWIRDSFGNWDWKLWAYSDCGGRMSVEIWTRMADCLCFSDPIQGIFVDEEENKMSSQLTTMSH